MSDDIQLWSRYPEIEPVSWKGCSLELRQEAAILKASDFVAKDSVRILRTGRSDKVSEGFLYIVQFIVLRDTTPRAPSVDIRAREPFVLVYSSADLGYRAPTLYADRSDFPTNLPHLNPVATGLPVNPCLSRQGNDLLYEQGGVAALISTLSQWLFDAATGNLEHDGWEPTLVPGFKDGYESCIDAAYLQQYAFKHPTGGVLRGLAELKETRLDDHTKRSAIFYNNKPLERDSLWRSYQSKIKNKKKDSLDGTISFHLPWYFLWPDKSNVTDDRACNTITAVDALRSLAYSAGSSSQLDIVLTEIRDRRLRLQLFAVALGLWRPKPLIPAIPGLATGEARRLELLFFLCAYDKDADPDFSVIAQTQHLSTPTRNLFLQASGLQEPLPPVAVIGCGALGSHVSDFLYRSGCFQLSLVDYDSFAPHNIARHILREGAIGFNKAQAIKREFESIAENHCRARALDITRLTNDDLKKAVGERVEHIIDATASQSVLRRLSTVDTMYRVTRIEIVDEGRLGFTLSEGPKRNPRIDDLQMLVYASANECPEVACWLSSTAHTASTHVGIGCSSATMVMPDSTVCLHASSFMPRIRRVLHDPTSSGGFLVTSTDEFGTPMASSWTAVPPLTLLELSVLQQQSHEKPWMLRIHTPLLDMLTATARSRAPNEAGGYLYGRYDIHQRSVTVVWGNVSSPLSTSPTRLTLPPAGRSRKERHFIEAIHGTCLVMGSWHNHPLGSSQPSYTDLQQVRKAATLNTKTPVPFVFLILGRSDKNAYLSLPQIWHED